MSLTKVTYSMIHGAEVSVLDFGAIGDGDPAKATANTAAIQAAVNYCIANKKALRFPRGTGFYAINAPITISAAITIIGEGNYNTGLACLACEAFTIAAEATAVVMEKLFIGLAVRHTTTPNTLKAIRVEGTSGTRPDNHIYRDMYVDGFETAMYSSWASNITMSNFRSDFGKVGIEIVGDGVNNVVTGCGFGVSGVGSKGVYFSDDVNPTEGWMFSENLLFGAEVGLHSYFTNNCHFTDNIIDFCTSVGIKMEGTGGSSTNWTIRGNYIAMSGPAGSAGILLANTTVGSSFRGSTVTENDILVYAGSTCDYGIVQSGPIETGNIISKNHVNGVAVYGIRISSGVVDEAIVSENVCPQGIFFDVRTQAHNNNGATLSGGLTAFSRTAFGQLKITYNNVIPPTATGWSAGDECKSNPPVLGAPKSWLLDNGLVWRSTGNL